VRPTDHDVRNHRAGGSSTWIGLAIVLAGVLTWLVHGITIGYGFHYDDYHFVHPYSRTDVLAAFHGPWDPAGIETGYFRPLTICLYAARFAAFGLNARANHVAGLALFAVAAALFGVFAGRISGSRAAGLLAIVVFVVHPGMPYSATAWITNQMHVAELAVVLAALLWWFSIRASPARWWVPLLVFQAAAFLIKEDGVMLIPVVVALHLLRKYLVERELPHVPWRFVVASVLLGGVMLLLRSRALEGTPTHHLPSLDFAWRNWTRGFSSAYRLLPARRPWQAPASWFVTLAPIAAALLWTRISQPVRFTLIAGLALGVLFLLPFAFIIKAEQLHLIAAGAALLLTGAVRGLFDACKGWRPPRAAVAAVAVAGVAAMTAVTRDITRDFEPYGPIVLNTDRMVEGWAAVPAELREFLALKRSAGAQSRPDPDPSRTVPLVAFGLYGRERSPDGRSLRWMSGPASDIYVRRGTRLLSFALRHEIGAFGEPARAWVEADGRTVVETVLNDGAWHQIDLTLRQREWVGFSNMHHVRIRIDHAWVPALVIRGSGDQRTLGLQVGEFQTR
jgi:hypothetical protein